MRRRNTSASGVSRTARTAPSHASRDVHERTLRYSDSCTAKMNALERTWGRGGVARRREPETRRAPRGAATWDSGAPETGCCASADVVDMMASPPGARSGGYDEAPALVSRFFYSIRPRPGVAKQSRSRAQCFGPSRKRGAMLVKWGRSAAPHGCWLHGSTTGRRGR